MAAASCGVDLRARASVASAAKSVVARTSASVEVEESDADTDNRGSDAGVVELALSSEAVAGPSSRHGPRSKSKLLDTRKRVDAKLVAGMEAWAQLANQVRTPPPKKRRKRKKG